MQTFLPYPDFGASADCLDRQRLGKQRVEVLQILRALEDPARGWANHPATKMWEGYEDVLACYGRAVCRKWKSLGYNDTTEDKINELRPPEPGVRTLVLPFWLGEERFHAGHRSHLWRKDPSFYGSLWPDELGEHPLVWPVYSLDLQCWEYFTSEELKAQKKISKNFRKNAVTG